MPVVGRLLGYDQPIAYGAKRYLDVLHGQDARFRNGAFYASPRGKVTGPLQERTEDHLLARERQEAAWQLISELARAGESAAGTSLAERISGGVSNA